VSQVIPSRVRTFVQEWCAFIDAKSIAVLCLCDAAGADPDYCPHPAEQSRALVRLRSAHYLADAESPAKSGLFGWRRREAIRKIARSDRTRGSRHGSGIIG
jgi:hypothetical protein